MILVDDRTEEQRKTNPVLVIGTDKFMSGWGGAEGGASYAIWACAASDASAVQSWVESRPEMLRVRVTVDPYRPNPLYCAHAHIYYVGAAHPALGGA